MNDGRPVRPLHLPAGFRHPWLLFVVVGCLNLFWLRRQFRARALERPDLAEGCRRYFLALAVCLLLPWPVMGAGIEIGGVPHPFSFLSLSDRNPYVIAFHAVITTLLALTCHWVCLRRGAEFLLAHPGTLGRNLPGSPAIIRTFRALLLAFWLAMLVLRWMNLLPEPPLG